MESESPSSELDEQLAEATKLAEDGDPEGAFELLLQLENGHPEDPALLCMLGYMASEADASGMSYDYFRRCLATQPEDPHLLAMLGAGLARFDDPDAEGVLRLAAVTSPGLALARFHYGSYLAREGILDLAVAELGAAREIEPENPEVLREIAIAHLLAGADSLATDALEDASALAPDDADLHLLHALTLLRRGSVAEAAEELHATAHAFDHDMEIQLLAALACASQEWTDEAWSALTRAEAAADASDEPLVREVEELIEAGPAPAQEFLVTQLAPGVLRERLFTRS